MVIRRISVRLYLAAATLVLVIIATGSLLAGLVNLGRTNELDRRWSHQHTEWQRVQLLHSDWLRRSSTEDCVAVQLALRHSAENLNVMRRKLDRTLTSSFGEESNRRVLELKREQAGLTLAHWDMATTLRGTCGPALPPVLYLYSGKSCSECFFQTKILLFMERRHHPELLVFPVDLEFAPADQVAALLGPYNVTSLPTSIIAGTKYEGFLSRDMLQKILVSGVARSTSPRQRRSRTSGPRSAQVRFLARRGTRPTARRRHTAP